MWLKATDPIEHGFRFGRQGGEGVVVVGLPEHLQLRGRLPLLTSSAHCRGTRLGTQLVQTRPGGDAVGESEPRYVDGVLRNYCIVLKVRAKIDAVHGMLIIIS